MGFFRSIGRFFATLFGLAQGSTERATDALLTASPDAIRSQFRKTREDWVNDYNQMKDAVAELCKIRQSKSDEVERLQRTADQLSKKMAGAIELFKKNGDEALRESYSRFASEREKLVIREDELVEQITEQEVLIETYKGRLLTLQENIEKLKEEEAATVADIVSSRKINELNDKLKGLSTDTQAKNIDAIREARQKAKAKAKLSTELSGADQFVLDNKLMQAGQASVHLSEFDEAVRVERIFTAETPLLEAAPQEKTTVSVDAKEDKLNALFKS